MRAIRWYIDRTNRMPVVGRIFTHIGMILAICSIPLAIVLICYIFRRREEI